MHSTQIVPSIQPPGDGTECTQPWQVHSTICTWNTWRRLKRKVRKERESREGGATATSVAHNNIL